MGVAGGRWLPRCTLGHRVGVSEPVGGVSQPVWGRVRRAEAGWVPGGGLTQAGQCGGAGDHQACVSQREVAWTGRGRGDIG